MALRGAGFMYDKLMKLKEAECKKPIEFTYPELAKEVANKEIDYISDCLKILVDKFYDEKSINLKSVRPFFHSIEDVIDIAASSMDFWFVDDEIEDKLEELNK